VTNSAGVTATDEVKVYVQRDTEVLFGMTPDLVPQNTPIVVEYFVPWRIANRWISLEAPNAWGGTNVISLNGSAGYHKETIWSWNKNSFGGSGPWQVKCKVNGIVKQTLSLRFE
jgi:hypothetical protein